MKPGGSLCEQRMTTATGGSVHMCGTGTFECVHVNYVCVVREREELQGCFNSHRKEAVSEWMPGCWV